jgi:Uma2 family endonuclease
MNAEQFYDFCTANPDLRIELTAAGEIVKMSPAGAETSYRNCEFTAQLRNWSRQDGRGRALGSNVEYLLPDGSAMCPDASWVERPDI